MESMCTNFQVYVVLVWSGDTKQTDRQIHKCTNIPANIRNTLTPASQGVDIFRNKVSGCKRDKSGNTQNLDLN